MVCTATDHKESESQWIAREWLLRWSNTLAATPWRPNVPTEAEHDLIQLIDRAMLDAYAAGSKSVQDLYEKIRTAGESPTKKDSRS